MMANSSLVPTVAVLAVAITGCGDAPRVGAELASDELVEPHVEPRSFPVWTPGQGWVSILNVDAPYQGESSWVEYIVVYKVLDVASDGTAKVRACEQLSMRPESRNILEVTWTFDPMGRIVDVDGTPFTYACDWTAGRGYHDCDEYWPGLGYLWPRFPLMPSAEGTAEVAPHIRRDGEIFRIEAPHLEHDGLPTGKRARAHMQWKEGRPWYDMFRIDVFDAAHPESGWRPHVLEHVKWHSGDETQRCGAL